MVTSSEGMVLAWPVYTTVWRGVDVDQTTSAKDALAARERNPGMNIDVTVHGAPDAAADEEVVLSPRRRLA